jgi:folate-binding protein YgfZ
MSQRLESVEPSQGAVFAPSPAPGLPLRFSDPQTEWSAVRQRCGLLDARFRALLRLTGSDRKSFLQGMVSNDVAVLQEGEGTYAALLTEQGKIVSDLRIYVLAGEVWLDTPAARAAAVRENLERYIIADDVEFAADPRWAPLVVVEGPRAARTLLSVTGEAVEGLKPLAHRELAFDGTRVRVVAATHTGEGGFLLLGDPEVRELLWQYCLAAGAEPVGMETLNVLRVEAGIPWHGCDMTESTLIGEVGIEAAISYKKGCYLGQEVVERVAARGRVHRKLVGLVCEGDAVPQPQAKLARDGKEVGWITSAVWSPARQSVVALGYVRQECWEVGTEVRLTEGGNLVRVTALPFYGRQQSL